MHKFLTSLGEFIFVAYYSVIEFVIVLAYFLPSNLILMEPNDDAQSDEDLDDDEDGDESDGIHGDDPIRGLDMIL